VIATIRHSSPKMINLSSFTDPYAVPKLYVFLSSVEHKRRCFCTMEVNGHQNIFGCQHSSKYLLLCSTEV